MPINAFNVGRDVVVNIQAPTSLSGGASGTPTAGMSDITFSIMTHFDARPMQKKQESHGLDGIVRFQYIPGGWHGTFEIDRANRTADDFQAILEALYYAGANIPSGTITETITEPDGSTSQYVFERVMFWVDDPGAWRGDAKVTQRVEFCASKRTKKQ